MKLNDELYELKVELQEQRDLLDTIINSIPNLLVLKDKKVVYQHINSAFCKFMGKAEDALKTTKDDLEIKVEERTAELESAVTLLKDEINDRKQIELALKDSDKKYRNLVENSIVGVVTSNLKGDILYANNAIVHMFEYESINEVLKENTVTKYKDPAQRERIMKILKEKGRFDNYEVDLVTKKGNIKNILTSSVLEGDINTAMLVDITGRRKAEKSLIIKDRAIESSINAICITDTEANITYVNSSFIKMWGYDNEEEVLGKSALGFWHYPQKAVDVIKILNEKGNWVGELNARKKDGTLFDVQLSATIVKDSSDIPLCMMGSFIDITESKRTEEARKISEKKYRDIVETSNEGVWIIDRQANTTFANKQIAELLGYTVEEMIGRNLFEFMDEDGRKEAESNLERRKKGIKDTHDFRFKRKDGSDIWTIISTNPLTNDKGEFTGALGMITDITERKRAEESLNKANLEIAAWSRELENRVKEKTKELLNAQSQLIQSEKLSAMGEMAGGLAHELNSPLAGLIPMIEKHKNEEEKDSKRYYELSLMYKACEYMAKIVRDFSSFSRESKGKLTKLNLNEAINDTLNFSISRIKQKGIQLIKEYEDNLPSVYVEKTELQQVILNMITNALDAMTEGGTLNIKTSSRDNKNIIMEFIDNGSGIEKDKLDKIFDPFYTTKRPGKGTGLGLSVSYKIIEKHEGKISAESEPGQGTKFKISLPAAKTNTT